jgi:predicted aldo/keto reductase-like oxidoreductase
MATLPVAQSGTFPIGATTPVNRLGFGAMQLTGPGVWGDPRNPEEAVRVLRRAVELGVNFIDTADSYGPFVSEELIRRALHPYPAGHRFQRGIPRLASQRLDALATTARRFDRRRRDFARQPQLAAKLLDKRLIAV